MSADVGIDQWLRELGYGLSETRARARAALEAAGLTRTGKQRLSTEKLPKCLQALRERCSLHCATPDCVSAAAASGREPLRCEPRQTCEWCGGSDNQRVVNDFVAAFTGAGLSKLVVVGGSPAVREELQAALGPHLQLRLVDGTTRLTSDRARADLEWADLLLLWGASELHHKVSMHFSTAPPPLKRRVLHVTRRGIAALLSAGLEHLARR